MKRIFGNIFSFAGIALLGLFALLLLSIVRTSFFGEVEPEKHIYFEIVFLLLVAVLGELAAKYTKQPGVMVLMILGILISPSFLALAWKSLLSLGISVPLHPPDILRNVDVIHVFAQLGAIILLFKVGLESKIEKIFAKENLAVAIAGVVLPFVVGYFYASTTGGNFAYAMFVGAALTATSVGVTVALLKEFKLVTEHFAEIIIGAAVLDDILGLLVLSLVINVTGSQGAELTSLTYTFGVALVFLAGAVFAGRWAVDYLDKKEFSQRRFLVALALVIFYAYVAEYVKLSAIVGAFIAGLVLSKSKHSHELEEKSWGLELLFMPIFFISLGTLIDVNALFEFAIPLLVISVLALLTKLIGCGLAAKLVKLKTQDAILVGVGMAPRGEVALIIASIGLSTAILTQSEYSVIVSMALITTFVTPPLMQHLLESRTAS